MSQLLIVEGNDAIPIANLLRKRKLLAPIGYEDAQKFKDEFIKKTNGYNNLPKAIEEALSESDLTNIGIILDANDVGAKNRWESLKSLLSGKIEEIALETIQNYGTGKVIKDGNLTIGIWIMPDNQNAGYLEHFLAKLIPARDKTWNFAQETIATLKLSGLQAFSDAKTQKALLHTWLAWQKEPGRPFGQAAELGYFDVASPVLDDFEEWFKATFQLSAPV
jgi:hypothetical protein